MAMGEANLRQTLKGHHRTRVEGLYSSVHKQEPLAIAQQQPKVPSPVAYDQSAMRTYNVMSTHT
jgi:hypothetical protein